jgi:TolB-like protein/Tfp pilus assembly protein PilF
LLTVFKHFLRELQRRKVIRVAGVYAVAAWGVFTVADKILETLQAPPWMSTVGLFMLVLGFPVALVLAWMFERRQLDGAPGSEAAAAAGPALNRSGMLLVAAMVLVIGLVGAQIGGLVGGRASILGGAAPHRSVAVLPFTAFGQQNEMEYFADGLTEEVINTLAQTPELKVAGRTSAFYFKGRNEDLREVGKRLGVAHVVEGSVRRDGTRLRVTAQLVSVKDGFHLWSKTYDRTLDDAFAIQTEIGEGVAEALKAKLEIKDRAKGLKRDPAAYQLELTSRAHLRRTGLEDLEAAVAGYRRLTVLEAENADAWAGYAHALILLAQHHMNMDFAAASAASQAAADRALQLNPKSSEAWLAKAVVGMTLAIRQGDTRFDRGSDDALRKALALDPRNTEALTLLSGRLARGGQPVEAERLARRAAAIDPLSRTALSSLGRALTFTGKLDAAERAYRSVVSLHPDFAEGPYHLAMLLVEKGRLDEAEPLLRAVARRGDDPYISFQTQWLYYNLGLVADGDAAAGAIKGSPGRELGQAGTFAFHGDWAGMLAYGRKMAAMSDEAFWPTVIFQAEAMLGHYEGALVAIRPMRPDLFTAQPVISTMDLNAPILVAHVMRRVGQSGQGGKLLDEVLAATTPVKGGRMPNDWRLARAKVFAERGQSDLAIAELQAAYDAGWRTGLLFDDNVWVEDLPTMRGLRTDPRLVRLMAQIRADLATQQAAVTERRAAQRRAAAATGGGARPPR